MDECNNKSGWNAVKCVWREYSSLYIVPPFVTGLFVGFAFGFSINNLSEFIQSLLPELVGIGITLTGIYYLEQWRQSKVEERRLKKELLWQVTSRSRDVAIGTIDRIRHEGWLCDIDGILKGIVIPRAQWAGANLCGANLEDAVLNFADLEGTNLMGANLRNTKLFEINLINSELNNANLDMANFTFANLRQASITNIAVSKTIVSWVNFSDANLSEVNFENSQMREWIFQRSNIWGVNFENVFINACNFRDAKNVSQARFENTRFKPLPQLNSDQFQVGHLTDWRPYVKGSAYNNYPEDWKIRVKLIDNPYIDTSPYS